MGVCYHCYEDSKLRIHLDGVAIGEEERFALLLFGGQDNGHLLGCHREDRKFDAVELIEASPAAGLGQAFVDSSKASEEYIS